MLDFKVRREPLKFISVSSICIEKIILANKKMTSNGEFKL